LLRICGGLWFRSNIEMYNVTFTRFLAARQGSQERQPSPCSQARPASASTDFYFGGERTDQSREGDILLPIFSGNVI
jgi:hypothetical protein